MLNVRRADHYFAPGTVERHPRPRRWPARLLLALLLVSISSLLAEWLSHGSFA